MLPAWATVVVALGASLIGALAGTVGAWFTFRSAQLNVAHQEREAWRVRLIDAADAFGVAVRTIDDVLYRLERTPSDDLLQGKYEDVDTTLLEAATRVALIFGPNSNTYTSANEAALLARSAFIEITNAAESGASDDHLSEAHRLRIHMSDTHLAEFLSEASVAIRER